VTVGNEGFYAGNFNTTGQNPQAWAADMGQDFMNNGAIDSIDFVTIHMWPDNWGM
jgi:mannan endo-1,4-beta-mannosidase